MSGVELGRARIVDAGLNKVCVQAIQIVQRRGDAVDVSRRDDDAEVAITDQPCDRTVLGQCQDRPSKSDILVELYRDLQLACAAESRRGRARRRGSLQRFVVGHWRLSGDAAAQSKPRMTVSTLKADAILPTRLR